MKVATTVTETTIELTLEPTDGTDKLVIPIMQGCTVAKVEVNGVIKFVLDRPKRPMKFEVDANRPKEGGEQH